MLFTQAAQKLGVPPPITIQNDFSLVFRHFEEELAEACAPSNCNVRCEWCGRGWGIGRRPAHPPNATSGVNGVGMGGGLGGGLRTLQLQRQV